MTPQFRTIVEALAAGYRRPGRGDLDISGPNSFGYAYRDEEGRETVTVSLTEERNKIGEIGSFTAMFPPRASH